VRLLLMSSLIKRADGSRSNEDMLQSEGRDQFTAKQCNAADECVPWYYGAAAGASYFISKAGLYTYKVYILYYTILLYYYKRIIGKLQFWSINDVITYTPLGV
jgi:hypothetical protein